MFFQPSSLGVVSVGFSQKKKEKKYKMANNSAWEEDVGVVESAANGSDVDSFFMQVKKNTNFSPNKAMFHVSCLVVGV